MAKIIATYDTETKELGVSIDNKDVGMVSYCCFEHSVYYDTVGNMKHWGNVRIEKMSEDIDGVMQKTVLYASMDDNQLEEAPHSLAVQQMVNLLTKKK